MKGFADIARPLHKACQKRIKFTWTETGQHAFEKLKKSMITPPILIYPLPGKRFILDTDASDKAVGAILSQQIDDKEHVIAYTSKALNKDESSYCTTRKELFAVISPLNNFNSYNYGQNVLLRTDNAAFSWMRNLKNHTGQVARWLQEHMTNKLSTEQGGNTQMRISSLETHALHVSDKRDFRN